MSTADNTETEKKSTSNALAPEWLTAQLFDDLFKRIIEDYKHIQSFKAAPGVSAGENYGSVMLRLEFEIELTDGKSKSHSLMIKLGHVDSPTFQEIMKYNNYFITEHEMYARIVPELEQIYRDVGVDVTFGAKGYEIKAPADYVLLEDLSTKGFKNANRLEGLDIEHTQCVLRKLAQWHAASAMRVAVHGAYPESIAQGYFKEENRQMMKEGTLVILKEFIDCAATYEGHEAYIAKIHALMPRQVDCFFELANIDANEFNALNHGDCWSNNVMFQYDANGKVKETYLVDYQMPKYGSIAQDLYYFLISSTKLDFKLSKFDYFIKYYHDSLVEHLKLLKYDKPLPKLRDLHASLCRRGLWGYSTATGVMSVVLLDPTENANLDNFLSDSSEGVDLKNVMYSNARYRKHIEAVLPWLHNRGAIDV